VDRLQTLRQHIDLEHGRGLEIGPLVNPLVRKSESEVYYVDRATTEELREWFSRDPKIDPASILEVDFAWGANTLAQASAAKLPFDYVVASHVVEHVPDLIGWLNEVAEVLRPGGRLGLVVPDRRYTFDVRRRPSDIAELVEAHLLGLRRPAARATFDHFYRHVDVDTSALWRGEPGHADPPMDVRGTMASVARALRNGEYIDTHCWVFSDAEFAEMLRLLMASGLVDLRVVAMVPTRVNEFEFFVTLERPDGPADDTERWRANAASVPSITPPGPAVEAPLSPHGDATAVERLARANAALAAEVAALRGSASWRLTAPLRRIHRLLRTRGGA